MVFADSQCCHIQHSGPELLESDMRPNASVYTAEPLGSTAGWLFSLLIFKSSLTLTWKRGFPQDNGRTGQWSHMVRRSCQRSANYMSTLERKVFAEQVM